MGLGVTTILKPPGRGLLILLASMFLVSLALGPLVSPVEGSHEVGTFTRLEPVETPYWFKCPSGEAVMNGNLTPAPLKRSDGTSEVQVPGPTFPKRTLSRIGTFTLELKDSTWDTHEFELHGIEGVSVWATSSEEVKYAQFRILFTGYWGEIANLYTETLDLDGTPREFRVTEPVSFPEPLHFDGFYPLEVEIQYRAASRTVGGPAPDCVFLAGSTAYPSRIDISVIPMDIKTGITLGTDERMCVIGQVEDTSTLDPEKELDYRVSIYRPNGEMVDPLSIEFDSFYVRWDHVSTLWYWYYNLTDNMNGSYTIQLDVSYGIPNIHYSNSSTIMLYFDGLGTVHFDYDGDGHPDNEDAFWYDPDEWADSDGDGLGDNADDFPFDANETRDSDGDGVGDNTDQFPLDPTEWCDSDGDGYGDNCDEFPRDVTEWTDSDGDGYGDNCDCFPGDTREWCDSDGDGHGDNGDAFPFDELEWRDSDGDGRGDNSDLFPNDASEWADADGDGHGDNGDDFPDDVAEWADSDGDGHGDNSDDFPMDVHEWKDSDGDGHGDNGDRFPQDTKEWADADGDGLGDNADDFPLDPAASMDSDGDGHPDDWNEGATEADSTTGLELDQYPHDANKWRDEVGSGGPSIPLDPINALLAILILGLLVGLVLLMRGRSGDE